jgi:hypothetical protein
VTVGFSFSIFAPVVAPINQPAAGVVNRSFEFICSYTSEHILKNL